MKRVLCIVGRMDAGGAETFLMKVYRGLDRSKYQMDFAVTANGVYDDEIKSLGGKIYFITPKSSGLLKNFFSIKRLVKKEKYKYVLRTSQHSLSALELLAARLGGAKKLVYRSSNSNTTSGSRSSLLIHRLCRFMPKIFANVRIAPSTEAAEFMFGKKCVEKGKAYILKNGIDLSIYHFDEAARERIRDEFNISDKLVIGHVGRFNRQKNHKKLIEIFASVKSINPNSVLMLIGKGELEDEIKKQLSILGLTDSVIFTGVRNDVPKLLSTMDVFVFPSLYEGMPNTVIEAQACGLPCVVSDTITKEADVTGLVKYLPLDLSHELWAKEALNSMQRQRIDTKELFVKNSYDIGSVINKFITLVFGDINE